MASSSIPLHCNICPKRPNFSDVSHLLTHIASKGHLSNYYKVKVRSSTEDGCRRLIEAYDRWYADWNVEELMSERMSQKEKRRTRTRASVARPSGIPKPEIHAPRPNRSRGTLNIVDPRLGEQVFKHEPSVTPTPPPMFDYSFRQRVFPPHMQLWPTASRCTSVSYASAEYENSSDVSDPSDQHGYQHGRRRESIRDLDDSPMVAVDEHAVPENAKLKGVYWPGMDIFDSATPEMRRKRNQKKEAHVLEQLEINSQEVEPTEMIFTPLGTFKKQRRISGSVYDDSSPVKEETTPKKPYLSRPALAEVDVNSRYRGRPLTRPPPSFPYTARSAFDDEQAQLGYPYGDIAPRKKRGFDVFQDQEVSFAHPAGFNYLTSEFHHQQSQALSPALPTYKSYVDTYQFDNKENYAYHQHQVYDNTDTTGLPFPNFYQGFGQEQHHVFHNPLYLNAYHHQPHEEVDDQRTLTAPPSPSTG